MNDFDLTEAIESIGIKNSLDVDSVIEVLKKTFQMAVSEILNTEIDDVIVNIVGSGVFSIGILRDVVDKVRNKNYDISLKEAQKVDPDVKLDDRIEIPLNLKEFTRQQMNFLNRMLKRSFLDINKEIVYQDYKSKEGTLITGSIVRKHNRDYFVSLDKVEARLSLYDQSPRDSYEVGKKFKFYLKEVEYDDRDRLNLSVSRSDVNFVKRLFELEAPELLDGTVRIHNVVREVGKKVKMAVYSTKIGVEPVGTCVGFSGVRIKEVIKELGGEKIDVIPYVDDVKFFLEKSLQPAQVKKIIIIDSDKREAIGIVDDANYPLAVGKAGLNINLACQLTHWRINLKTISQIEKHPKILGIFSKVESLFKNEVDLEENIGDLTSIREEVLVKLMNNGIKSVSELYEKSKSELITIDGITEKDVKEILRVLDEVVEVVDQDMDIESANEAMSEFEDSIEGVETEEEIIEKVEEIEYLVCPHCSFEFQYIDQTKCPSCLVEFEFEEEEV